ncbi:MAG: hypothetical protein ACTSWR_00775 [Candidatus Helarchaeota archaeon]
MPTKNRGANNFPGIDSIDVKSFKQMQVDFKLADEKILIIPLEQHKKVGNIYLSEVEEMAPFALVINVGKKIQNIKPGDLILTYRYAGASMHPNYNDVEYHCAVINEDDVILKFSRKLKDLKGIFNLTGNVMKSKSLVSKS